MGKKVWLIAGNKGGAGKSVVAKSLVEWLREQDLPVVIADGDKRSPDVASVFNGSLPTVLFDLHTESGWPLLADYLCQTDLDTHVVTNLPDGINDRALIFFERFVKLMAGYGHQLHVLFVMNNLPDGLHLFARLQDCFSDIVPVKNLYFGRGSEFRHFDEAFGEQYEESVIHFPAMQENIMKIVRESHLSYLDFERQTDDAPSNFTYAKIVVAQWRDEMLDALDDQLTEKV